MEIVKDRFASGIGKRRGIGRTGGLQGRESAVQDRFRVSVS
jgi:hypothetical protein